MEKIAFLFLILAFLRFKMNTAVWLLVVFSLKAVQTITMDAFDVSDLVITKALDNELNISTGNPTSGT